MSRAQVCRDMCLLAGMPDLWTEDGPTELALSFVEQPHGRLAGPRLVIFNMAWSLWTMGDFTQPGPVVEVPEAKQAMLEELVAASLELAAQLVDDPAV